MSQRLTPGWYPNQLGPGYRYWDGERWTRSYFRREERSPTAREQPQPDPAAPAPGPAQDPSAEADPATPAPTQARLAATTPRAPVAAAGRAPAAPSYSADPDEHEAPSVTARLVVAALALVGGLGSLAFALSVPHAADEVLLTGGYYLKETYFYWLMIGGGEAALLGGVLATLTVLRSEPSWLRPLLAAAMVIGALMVATAASAFLTWSTTEEEVPASQLAAGAPAADSGSGPR